MSDCQRNPSLLQRGWFDYPIRPEVSLVAAGAARRARLMQVPLTLRLSRGKHAATYNATVELEMLSRRTLRREE
jgi:hypothetical protein